MLMHRILAALIRCGHRISVCAATCIQDLASTLKGYYRDRKLGNIDTSYSHSDGFTQNRYGDAIEYVPSGYAAITAMLRHIRFSKDDVFVDFGCGKGRVIFAVATRRLKKVVGIELDKTLVDIARANLVKFRKLKFSNSQIEILHLDVTSFDPKEGTIFFMFNPFGNETTQHVLNKIKTSLVTHPRAIRILYSNPKCRLVLDMQDWLVAGGEIGNSGLHVWRNRLVPQTHSIAETESVFKEL